jgi:A/G-specific adenine glycosylase
MTVSVSKKDHNARRGRHKPSVAKDLLDWYDTNRRDLPWRAKPGVKNDPYRVWLSEIMLQQTTVPSVGAYYRAFLLRWPSVADLARATQDEVLGAWAGLGYYSRARNLHRAAQVVAAAHGGVFPSTAAELRTLPGVGPYTAAAVAAIAFDEVVAALDTNGERILSRLFAIEAPLPQSRKRIAEVAADLVPTDRPGDFAQALMDLGSAICTPKRPGCLVCPLSLHCRARVLGIAENLPVKKPKPDRPLKRGAAYVAFDEQGAVHLVRRPEKGLLGGMLQPSMGEWRVAFPTSKGMKEEAPFQGPWRKCPGIVSHGFTHFLLELEVYAATFTRRPNSEGLWLPPERLDGAALPTVMKKVIRHAEGANPPKKR